MCLSETQCAALRKKKQKKNKSCVLSETLCPLLRFKAIYLTFDLEG